MTRNSKAMIAAFVGLAALLMPVQGTAALLVGGAGPAFDQVVEGMWIFKAGLLLHAGLLLLISRLPTPSANAMPLVQSKWLPPAEPIRRVEVAAVGLVLAVAAGLRLYDLGDGLWFDEIQTLLTYMRLPVGQVMATFTESVDSQNNHILYSVLARLSIALFGESGWALRLPAALLGVGSLAALYWFGRLVAGRWEALLAITLLTFSYHHVWFSQNARGYTGLLLWTLIGSGMLLKMLREPGTHGWSRAAAYGLAMALAVYTHVTAVFVVAAHVVIWAVLAIQARRRGAASAAWLPFMGFVFATTFSIQLYALVLPQFVTSLFQPTMEGIATEWKNPAWLVTEMVRGLAQGLPGGLVTVVGGIVIAVAGMVSYTRRSWVVLALMLGPALFTAAVLLVLDRNLWPRFFFFSAGFAALIAIRGAIGIGETLMGKPGRTLATAALVLLAAGSAFTVPGAWHPKQDYIGARDYVQRARSAGDAVVTVDMSRYVYQEYLAPEWLGISSVRELETVERNHARTWVLYTFPARLSAIEPDIWSRVEQHYKTAAEFPGTVNGGTIVVKVRS